jgi:uncharacterized membrane protein
MALIIGMIVVPIIVIWLAYKIFNSFYRVTKDVYEAEKENKAYAAMEEKDDAKSGT